MITLLGALLCFGMGMERHIVVAILLCTILLTFLGASKILRERAIERKKIKKSKDIIDIDK